MSMTGRARWYMTYRGMSEQEAYQAVAADIAAERRAEIATPDPDLDESGQLLLAPDVCAEDAA